MFSGEDALWKEEGMLPQNEDSDVPNDNNTSQIKVVIDKKFAMIGQMKVVFGLENEEDRRDAVDRKSDEAVTTGLLWSPKEATKDSLVNFRSQNSRTQSLRVTLDAIKHGLDVSCEKTTSSRE